MTDSHLSPQQASEIARRRTFAIISHPDAGKTTLTEKLLLYGGALQLAGSVTARKNQRSTASDWMEMEKKRGISVSSTVLQFEYGGYCVNLLDTPGHKDFSEDTYRVLTAVDSAVIVLDAAKGIESQTLKLFEVCRRRGVPIFVFINKMDRPARPPLELLDELERVLELPPVPLTWPLGDGPRFRGVYDREKQQVCLFERTPHGSYRAPMQVRGIQDDSLSNLLDEDLLNATRQEIELLDGVTQQLDVDLVRAEKQMPVFFGSAMNNFGVQHMLERFLDLAPEPAARRSGELEVKPEGKEFSGFVFKIQANMNPKHRDRAAFVRVVSGVFKRDMTVLNARTRERVRLGNSQRLFGQDRETLDEAYAGDVVALVGNYDFLVGDTVTTDAKVNFDEMPRFPPECFSFVVNQDASTYKRFREGLDQLLKEGVAQPFHLYGSHHRVPLLGAVGPLQFEVLQSRLENEYNAPCRIESASWNVVRWLREKEPARGSSAHDRPAVKLPSDGTLAQDAEGLWVLLLPSDTLLRLFCERNPGFEVLDRPYRPTV